MRNCEKIKGECRNKIRKPDSDCNGSFKYHDKATEYTLIGYDFRMTKVSIPGLKTKIIIVEEL